MPTMPLHMPFQGVLAKHDDLNRRTFLEYYAFNLKCFVVTIRYEDLCHPVSLGSIVKAAVRAQVLKN